MLHRSPIVRAACSRGNGNEWQTATGGRVSKSGSSEIWDTVWRISIYPVKDLPGLSISVRFGHVLEEYEIEVASTVHFDRSLVVPVTAAVQASAWLQLHDLAKLPLTTISSTGEPNRRDSSRQCMTSQRMNRLGNV